MARKKVNLAYITNNSERKVSFRKRKKGFFKKVNELSTLCNVDVCSIIYSPYEEQPEVWPSQEVAETVLAHFERLPEMCQTKKMANLESFTHQEIKKVDNKLMRIQKKNKCKELDIFLQKCIDEDDNLKSFDTKDETDLSWLINQTINHINTKLEKIQI